MKKPPNMSPDLKETSSSAQGQKRKELEDEKEFTRRWPFQVNLSKIERELIDTARSHVPMAQFIRDAAVEKALAMTKPPKKK